MPTTYPPRPGTVTTDGVRTLSRYLNSPTLVTRDLRTLTDRQFIADRILRGRITATGGMVEYETGESIFPLGGALPEQIEPHAEFPLVAIGDGEIKLESVGKYGYRTEVTLEAVQRRADQPIVKARTKLGNGVVQRFDGAFMQQIANAKSTMNQVAGTSWSAGTGLTILRQILLAQAAILDLREGYNPTAILMDRTKHAILTSDEKVQGALREATVDNDVFRGVVQTIAGLEVIVAPTGTVGVTDPIVFDPDALGSIVSEASPPERAAGDNGVFADTAYYGAANATGGAEFWSLAAGRVALAIIQEPKSATVITGT